MKVVDPSGESWRVKRRWLPWRWRKRNPDDFPDVTPSLDVDDLLIGLAILVVMLVLAIFVPIVFVLAIAVAELFLLFLLLPLFVVLRAGRVARWPIEAWHGDQLVHAEAVRGWSNSKARMYELDDDIRLGRLCPASLPDTDGAAD